MRTCKTKKKQLLSWKFQLRGCFLYAPNYLLSSWCFFFFAINKSKTASNDIRPSNSAVVWLALPVCGSRLFCWLLLFTLLFATEFWAVKSTVVCLSATDAFVFSRPEAFVLLVILKLNETEPFPDPFVDIEPEPLLSGNGVTGDWLPLVDSDPFIDEELLIEVEVLSLGLIEVLPLVEGERLALVEVDVLELIEIDSLVLIDIDTESLIDSDGLSGCGVTAEPLVEPLIEAETDSLVA